MKAKAKNFVINAVWAEGINKTDLKELRNQVELTNVEQGHAIITNYPVHWERMIITKGSRCQLIYSEDLSKSEMKDLRKQVDMALVDPSYIIVANYPINWSEIQD